MQKEQRINKSFLLIDIDKYPFLDIDYAIIRLTSGNNNLLSQFLNDLTNCIATTPKLASDLVQDPKFSEPFINALNGDCDEALKIQLIKAMTIIYPISGENMIIFVDDGLTMCLHDLLSSDSLQILESSISLVCAVAESSYGRDSFILFGIHEILIDISLTNLYEQLTLSALEALKKIFSNVQTKIDYVALYDCLVPMKELINFESVKIVNLALECFIEMANQSSLLILELYDFGFAPKLVSFLDNPELASSSLNLIAIMFTCGLNQISTFLELGIFDILMNFIDTEHCANAFYALSNLVVSCPQQIIDNIDQRFIEKAINIAKDSSFDVKKEATFFIAYVALFYKKENIIPIMNNEQLLDIFIEMLNYNSALIQVRILDALIRFVYVAVETKQSDYLLKKFQSDEFTSVINYLIEEEENENIKERVKRLNVLLLKP